MDDKKKKELATVLTHFTSLPNNDRYFNGYEVRLRLITYVNNPQVLFDLRNFVRSLNFTGWTPKGIAINREQAISLLHTLPDIIREMEIHEQTLYGAGKEISEVQEDNQRTNSSTQEQSGIDTNSETSN
jgi:hypothetical protein